MATDEHDWSAIDTAEPWSRVFPAGPLQLHLLMWRNDRDLPRVKWTLEASPASAQSMGDATALERLQAVFRRAFESVADDELSHPWVPPARNALVEFATRLGIPLRKESDDA